MVVSSLQHQLLFHVSCRWWGKHHGCPSMNLFLSTSAHHPGTIFRNLVKYLETCMPQWQVSSLSIVGFHQWPLIERLYQVFDFKNPYSHLGECTEIPWGSLTSMMISLTLVNSIHQGMVIKWFLPCSTSRHLFTWLGSYCLGIGMNTLSG